MRGRGNVPFRLEVPQIPCLCDEPDGLMGLFRSGRGPRSFDYEPRYYNPDEDEDQELKRRMRARRSRSERRSPIGLLYLAGLLLLTLFIYQAL